MSSYFEEVCDSEGYLEEAKFRSWLQRKGYFTLLNSQDKLQEAFDVLKVAKETLFKLVNEGYDTENITIDLLP